MNIQKNIERFKDLGYETIKKDIEDAKEDLRVQEYFFKILNIGDKLNSSIEELKAGDSEKFYLRFSVIVNNNAEHVLTDFKMLDSKKKEFNSAGYTNKSRTGIFKSFKMLLSEPDFKLENQLFGNDISSNRMVTIEVNKKMIGSLNKLLLNDDLLKFYNYIKLSKGLPEKKTDDKPRNKI